MWFADSTQLQIQRVSSDYQRKYFGNVFINHPEDLDIWAAKNRIYVILRDLGGIAIVNAANSTVSTYSVCPSPSKLIVDSAHTQIYVLCSGSNSLSLVSLNSSGDYTGQSLLATDVYPVSMALNASLNRLYVTDDSSNNVLIYNTATNAITTRVSTVSNPSAIVVNSSTNLVTAFNLTSTQETQIVGATNASSNIDLGLPGISEASINPTSNKIFAISPSSNSLYFDSTTLKFTTSSITALNSRPLHVSSAGASAKDFVTYPNSNVVRLITENGLSSSLQDITVGNQPQWAFSIDSANKFYVSNFLDDSLSVLNLTSGAAIKTISLTSGCGPTKMNSLTISGTIYLYVICRLNDSIQVINTSSDTTSTPISLRLSY